MAKKTFESNIVWILNVISRIEAGRGRLQQFMGFGVGGKGVTTIPGYYATFRIFDHTRTLPMGRAPGSGPATISNNPIGDVPVRMMRFHEKLFMDYYYLGNLSPLMGPNAQVDTAGENYIANQERYLGERLNNIMEFMTAGMLRGQFYLKISGENFIPYLTTPTGNYITVSYQVPSGNTAQLNMLGAGNIIGTSWLNSGANIIQNLMDIKTAFAQLTGQPLKHVLINSSTWKSVITNTEVRNTAGSSITPFESYTLMEEQGLDKMPMSEGYAAVLRGDPTVQWHIMDHVLVQDGSDPSYGTGTAGTFIKMVADNTAHFLPDPNPAWAQMVWGSEYVVENPASQKAVLKSGLQTYKKFTDQPSGVELIALLNSLPVLYRPKATTFGTVIFCVAFFIILKQA